VQNRARAKDQNQASRPDRVAARNSDNSVEVISTAARLKVLVASRPPKPAPSITTVGFDCGIVLTTAMSSLARQCGSVSLLFYRCTADGFALAVIVHPQGPEGAGAPKAPSPISRDNFSSAATRLSVDGWVENKLSIPCAAIRRPPAMVIAIGRQPCGL
jgi:hypothetical protein